MTHATQLVQTLRARGVALQPHGDRLRVRPASRVTAEELDALRQSKAEVLRLLRTEHALFVPRPDPETTSEVFGPAPSTADLEAIHHELACALWDLREWQAGRQSWGGSILVHGRPLADWLPLDEIARILRGTT